MPSPQRTSLRFCKAFFEVRDPLGLRRRLRSVGAFALAETAGERAWFAWTPAPPSPGVTYLLRIAGARLVLEGPTPEAVADGWRRLDEIVRPAARALVAAGDDLQRFLPRPRRHSGDRPESWDPEYTRRVLGEFYAAVRRRWADLPHRALAGRTPRQAALDPFLRPRLEALLRRMQQVEVRRRERLQPTPLSVEALRDSLLGPATAGSTPEPSA